MLKSLSTQFAATLFLGPLGLVYSSMATAVFFTLLLAVMVFSNLGLYSVALIWPLSIVTGLLMVKLHNDQVRQSGTRLLLGPDESVQRLSPIGVWVRGVALLSLVGAGAFVAFLYWPSVSDSNLGRIITSGTGTLSTGESGSESSELKTAESDDVEQNGSAENTSEDSFAVIALPSRDVKPVVIDANSSDRAGSDQTGAVTNEATLQVQGAVVNLRQGPGTDFSIVTQVERGERLIEFARDGQWVNVETTSTGTAGWIYGQLVGPIR